MKIHCQFCAEAPVCDRENTIIFDYPQNLPPKRNPAVGRRDGSKKSRTGLMVEFAIRPATGGFSAKTLCLSLIPEYVPGIGISAKSAFYGHTMRFLRIRLYLTFCIGGFRSPQLCGKVGGSELKMPDAMQACRRVASSRRRGVKAQDADAI